MLYGRKAVEIGKEALFEAQLPSYARPYASIILRVAREEGLDPFLIFAIGDRETLWGTTSYLDVRGPSGRGDNGHGHGLMQLDDRDASNNEIIRSGRWKDPYLNVQHGARKIKAKQRFLAGTSSIKGFAENGRVYVNATQAAKRVVSAGWYKDPRPMTNSLLWRGTIAAYNTGEGSVLMSVAVGKDPQYTTAGGDYVSDVGNRAAGVATKYDKATGTIA